MCAVVNDFISCFHLDRVCSVVTSTTMLILKNFCVVLFLMLSSLMAERDDEADLLVLNDSDFEHRTQVSTGATTGDWLILMAPKGECKRCEKLEVVLRKVAKQFQNRVNVAKLDRDNSRLTLRRFQITSPSLKFFRHGIQWDYDGMYAESNIGSFISNGHEQRRGRYIPKQIDAFDAWQEDFVKEMKAAYKERRLPETNALLVTIAGVFVGLIVLACVLSPKKKKENGAKTKSEKRQSKKKR